MNTFRQLLETLRLARGWTQAQLAERSGIRQGSLSRYETGMRQPDPTTVAALDKTFGVTADFLRQGQQRRAAMAVDAHMRRLATAKASLW